MKKLVMYHDKCCAQRIFLNRMCEHGIGKQNQFYSMTKIRTLIEGVVIRMALDIEGN